MILTGSIVASMTFATLASFASLIFGNTAPEYLTTGLANYILSGAIFSILASIFASKKGIVAGIMDVPTAICAAMATSIAISLKGNSQDVIFSNIFTSVAITTFISGLFMMLVGQFKLGNMVRFIPYPVIAGFLAASGWLLIKGGISVAGGGTLELLNLSQYFSEMSVDKLSIGLIFSILLTIISRKMPNKILAIPILIILCISVFYIASNILGYSHSILEQEGWLLGAIPDQPLWSALTLPKLNLLNYEVLLTSLGTVFTVMVISTIQMLLNENGLEFATNTEIDVNKNLKRFGFLNLLTLPFASPTSFVWLSSTTLAHKMKTLKPMFGVIHGIMLLIFFFLGSSILSYFPKFVAGGMLIFLGIMMTQDWLINTRFSMHKTEYSVIFFIVLAVEFFDFLTGVTVGLVASIIIFVIRYGSSNVIKSKVDGAHFRSSKGRSIPDQRLLDFLAYKTCIIELQGYIFFGSANTLYETVKDIIKKTNISQLMIDFKLVNGIDSSALVSLAKIAAYTEKSNIRLTFYIKNDFKLSFKMGSITKKNYPNISLYYNHDKAIESLEEFIINYGRSKIQSSEVEEKEFFDNVYNELMGSLELQVEFEQTLKEIKPHLKSLTPKKGNYLYKQGDLNTNLYFINGGSIYLAKGVEQNSTRYETLGRWSTTGELGAMLNLVEPYNAIVEREGEVFSLSRDSMNNIEKNDPLLYSKIKSLIFKLMGHKLIKASNRV